jgi:predicted ATPase
MITRLEVDGFKSLRDFAVDLEPFTVLIGPNSAGKSNILEALALLSRLTNLPVTEAFKGGRGRIVDQFTRRGGESVKSMRFAAEFLAWNRFPPPAPGKDTCQSRFRYEIRIERQATRSGVERLVACDERLLAMRREDDAWMAAHPDYADLAGYDMAAVPTIWPAEQRVAPTRTALAQPHVHPAEASRALLDLQQYRLFRLDLAHLSDASDRSDAGDLADDASNLPTVLAELPEPLLGEIRADLVSLVPGIASFEVVPDGDTFRIEFELSGGERLPARLISDGTLRLLALLTALRMEPRIPIVGIEEPENGIYPGRLRALLDLLREECGRRHDDPEAPAETDPLPTQILMTTHSPVVLSALRSHPQHLRFIDTVRRNGERITRARTVVKPKAAGDGRLHVSPREIDVLLHAATSEEAG